MVTHKATFLPRFILLIFGVVLMTDYVSGALGHFIIHVFSHENEASPHSSWLQGTMRISPLLPRQTSFGTNRKNKHHFLWFVMKGLGWELCEKLMKLPCHRDLGWPASPLPTLQGVGTIHHVGMGHTAGLQDAGLGDAGREHFLSCEEMPSHHLCRPHAAASLTELQ